MDYPYRHTDAYEQEMFLAKSQASQLLEIWLNGRETNGHVAELRRDIDQQGLEIQKVRVDLSNHMNSVHPHSDTKHDEQHNMMWYAFRVFIVLGPLSYAALLAWMISQYGG